MQQEILGYLSSQRIGVLAVEMADGSPHAATLHYANNGSGDMFFFKTDRAYRKSEALLSKAIVRASIVIGFSESEMKTLQLDGEARLLEEDTQGVFESAYYGKFPEKRKLERDPNAVCFVFMPNWWRFTDWTKPKGKSIILSTD
jgi:uncharacterized protein YhbP (UPF0306 family)